MARKKKDPERLEAKDRVVNTVELRKVPAGTGGRIVGVAGLSWIRYRVRFDNHVEHGSINRAKLAREGTWDPETAAQEAAEAERRAAEEAERANLEPAAGGTEGAGSDEPAKSDAASKVPAHLLERSKAAKEKAKAKAAAE